MKNNELSLTAKAAIFTTLSELEKSIDSNIRYAEQEINRYKEDIEKYDKEFQEYEINWRIEEMEKYKERLQAYEYIKNNILNISL